MLIYVCHFHHHFLLLHLIVSQIWPLSRYSCFYLGSLHPRNFVVNVEYLKKVSPKICLKMMTTWCEMKCLVASLLSFLLVFFHFSLLQGLPWCFTIITFENIFPACYATAPTKAPSKDVNFHSKLLSPMWLFTAFHQNLFVDFKTRLNEGLSLRLLKLRTLYYLDWLGSCCFLVNYLSINVCKVCLEWKWNKVLGKPNRWR